MDGDLQNDPEDIPGMLKIAEERNLDMLAGIRQKGKMVLCCEKYLVKLQIG